MAPDSTAFNNNNNNFQYDQVLKLERPYYEQEQLNNALKYSKPKGKYYPSQET